MSRMFSLLLLLLFKFIHAEPFVRTCEPIRVEMCTGLGYNVTDESQRDAELSLLPFKPLVSFGCSKHLKLFLCSVSVPMCTEKVSYPIGPCRGLCEGVRERCFPVLKKFGFVWPDTLDCALFPTENNHEHMCMEGPKDSTEEDIRFSVDMSFQTRDCPPHHRRTDTSGQCVPLCDANFLFDAAEKKYAEIWVTVWAIICFVSSFIAALTLSMGGGRVKARPLVSLALCYCFVSAGWILRIITGRNMNSCLLEANPSDLQESDGSVNTNCAFVFLLVYYFGMAGNAWWVALCAWWLAKAGLSWPSEKLRILGSFLHIFAWGVPAAQTVGALVKREIDIDELTGTCYVGNKNSSILLSLVLIPQAVYLAFGIILLIFGSIYVMPKQQPTAAVPLTASSPRKESDILGALSTLYIIPTACVLGSIFYEYNNKDKWFFGTEKPALWPFLLKHLMSLFIGVSTLFWLWSKKTASAWKGVFKRMGPRKQLPVKCQIPLVTYPQNHYPQHIATLSTASRHSTRTHPHRKPRIHHHRNEIKTII